MVTKCCDDPKNETLSSLKKEPLALQIDRLIYFEYDKIAAGNAFRPLSDNPTKWSNTLKQFVGKLPMNCLCVFDHFVGLALKGLSIPQNVLIILFLALHLFLLT